MSTEETLRGIIAKIVHCDEKAITPQTTLKDLKADSLDLVQILIAMEDTFNLEVSDDDAKELKSFGDFVAYIDKHLAERGK